MLKKNKGTIILTTIITALPILVGLALWGRLPDTIATHFDVNGAPNGWSSKEFAVFGLPAILVAIHLACTFATTMDPKSKNIQDKIYKLVLWICPVISVLVCTCVYLYALGTNVNMALIAELMVAFMFIIIGNYLPKCRQSYTMGIRTSWALEDEENWNHTHRFGGWLWMAGGVIFLGLTVLEKMSVLWTVGIILVMALAPMLYSFLYYLRHKEDV